MEQKQKLADHIADNIDIDELADLYQKLSSGLDDADLARDVVEEAVTGVVAREAEAEFPQLLRDHPDVIGFLTREATDPL